MLYLAEVRKQKSGFMGKASTELKLLACQRTDQTWSAVQGEEIVPSEEIGNLENGALVMVEVGGNRQVQGTPKPGGPTLVNLLQNFSKLLVGQKEKDEEIEAWNQSLTIQAQELNQRQMELESELAQLDQMREEAQGLEERLQEAEQAKEETARLQDELNRKTQELEQAWEHLRGEQRKLEELKEEIQPATGGRLDEEQAGRMYELVAYLETTAGPARELREDFEAALAMANEQQANLDGQWQQLEEQRARAQEQQETADDRNAALNVRRSELRDTLAAVEQAQQELHEQQQALAAQEASWNTLKDRVEQQGDLLTTLSRLAAGAGESGGTEQAAVNIAELENMPLGELQGIVDKLQKDLTQVVQFVNEQEEELTAERDEIEEMDRKLSGASEYDRISLEQELADARDRYKMLDETLVGQRREVRERESILNQHLRVLQRRQGVVSVEGGDAQIDLGPVLSDLEAQQREGEEEVQRLEGEIEQLRGRIQPLQEALARQLEERDRQQQEAQQLEADWQQQQIVATELWATVNRTQELLQPFQESMGNVREKLTAISELVNQAQQTGEYQVQALGDLKEIIDSLNQ
ncbi:MAG: pilus motility taxis protein HmpF [Cyanobacteriota bacterium]|nr:pilus motility taxis protein HmpF [Cyanobacteriota bacterium]